jgi:GT2 family glycosyltransferase
MRRDAIEKLGPLSEKLDKMYYEDSEWQYRAHINGLKTIYEPRCIAIHHEGSSSGTDITKGMKKYQEINRVKFLKLMMDQTNLKIEMFNE